MAHTLRNDPDLWLPLFPWPSADAHKHARGRMVVVSGDAWSTGAARLAARGGLRIGAGVVTVLSPTEALATNAAHLEAVMLRGFDEPNQLAELAQTADAAVIGPAAGVGERTTLNLFALTTTGAALVIDADALTSFQDDPDNLFSVLDRDDVLTPHPGEFARLFPGLLEEKGREAAAREASERAGAVVILKGPETVIASPDGRVSVNPNGSPWLATAGSGDVLAGFCAGLIAQGMPSFEAACAAVWLHSRCAGEFGPGLISEDLPDLVPAALNELFVAKMGQNLR
ncbi:NAD(P)H-hydrate dehydratase [Caulobacter segnis]|uniref:NAD(P)H-hydrate dehydratase n=1 Tax=Caulobacter segnis TaxID=88688 RepID=UPI00240F5AC2|nr:NAD(P)H-hydrate dehydratase [Caulobacter segnis]MDG2521794.1 NAD(P)H-hydrate dehydratase [Caulobacter segnis]